MYSPTLLFKYILYSQFWNFQPTHNQFEIITITSSMSQHAFSPKKQQQPTFTFSIDSPSSKLNQSAQTPQLPITPNHQQSEIKPYDYRDQAAIVSQVRNNNEQYNTFQHETAIEIIIKLIERNSSRFFIRGLTYAYIQSLKKHQNRPELCGTQIEQLHPIKQMNWPFKQLYLLDYRTPEQQQLFEFVNLCATMIQSNFKRYITEKRHKIALKKSKRSHELITALAKGWKTYRVYNSKKIHEIRTQIKNSQKQIDLEEDKFTGRDARKLKMLYKYVQVHSKLFQQTFQIYNETGAWVFDENMKPKITHHYSKSQSSQLRSLQKYSNPIITASITEDNSELNEKLKENFNKSNLLGIQNNSVTFSRANKGVQSSEANNCFEQRPIRAKGAYVFDEKEIEIQKTIGNVSTIDNEGAQNGDESLKQIKRREQKEKEKKKMEKRQKYDPRKAIMEEKKRKIQQQRQKQEETGQTKQPLKSKPIHFKTQEEESESKALDLSPKPGKTKNIIPNQDKKKVKITNKSAKNQINKVKSKVNCWNAEKQPQPEWVKQYKSRMIHEQTKPATFDEPASHQMPRNPQKIDKQQEQKQRKDFKIQSHIKQQKKPVDGSQFEYSWQKKQIQKLKQKQEEITRTTSTHCLRQQLKAIHERNMATKNNLHRSISQLEEAYGSAYSQRYQRLIPKLQLLSYARGIQKQSQIPVISEQSQQLNTQFSYIEKSSGHFWALCSNHQKVYRGFLEKNINY